MVAEVLEEQIEDPEEPAAENVAEGKREAALEKQVEARQGLISRLGRRRHSSGRPRPESSSPRNYPRRRVGWRRRRKTCRKPAASPSSAPRCSGWARVLCSSEAGC